MPHVRSGVNEDNAHESLKLPGEKPNDWLLWQLIDSALPVGSFAHSNGLEATCHSGELPTGEQVLEWLQASLIQAGHASLPFVTACYDARWSLEELDCRNEVFLLNHVANRASKVQGRALLLAASRIFAQPDLQQLFKDGAPGRIHMHFAPVFGAVLCTLGFSRETTARAFLFCHFRGVLASAVRMGVVGPLEAQSLQYRLGPECEKHLARFLTLTLDDIAQTAPLIELWQASHDRLYSRLFQS